jgi:Flp pilus assembly protein TadG
VESALLLPVLFAMVLGTIEFGRLAWTRSALDFAVQEAARCAVVRPDLCATPAQTAAFAASKAAALGVPASAFTATTATCGAQVEASWSYRFLVYGLFPSAPTLRARACQAA